MMHPFVSVIMPAYNAEKYISSAIESILAQTYTNFELIIIEDCSTDKTLDVIQRYIDFRIKLLKNQTNKGIAYSTNKGIECAKGKYIALMDDDDIAVKERLELQVEHLEKNANIDILGGRSNDIDTKGNIIRWGRIPRNNPKYIKSILLFRCMDFRNGTTMIRKQFIDKYNLRYQENCYGMQDFKFFIDSSKVGNISTIGNLLMYYRVHENNETKRRMRDSKEHRKQKYAEFQRNSLKASGYILDENKLSIINKVLAEYDGGCENREELELLYEAFCEIMKQAADMRVDYYEELEHYCKLKLSEQVRKLIHFG